MTDPLEPATIYDVAEHAGVSISTVSDVLNKPERVAVGTRRRVLQVADDLGYLPKATAIDLARKQTVLEVDSRGQGTGYGWVGDTPDPHGHGPSYLGGFMTRGLLDPEQYYYRRLITDAVLAVDAAQLLPGVDPTKVVVAGISQGGGIALAVSALRDDLAGVMADVPFLSDFPRAVVTASAGPYPEIAAYLASHRHHADQAFATLAHVDAAVLVTRSTAPALFSVALMDDVCPPSTVYAAYNAYAGEKQIRSYPYNDHEGGQFHQEAEQLTWLRELLHP